jgi:hypothetical protein
MVILLSGMWARLHERGRRGAGATRSNSGARVRLHERGRRGAGATRSNSGARVALDQRDFVRINTLPWILRCVTPWEEGGAGAEGGKLSQDLINSLRTEVPSTSCRSVERSLEKRRSTSVSRLRYAITF